MNGVLLMVVAAAVLACGYLGYGRWLAAIPKFSFFAFSLLRFRAYLMSSIL